MKNLSFVFVFLCMNIYSFGQLTIEGYIYESGNRGFLNQVQISVLDVKNKVTVGSVFTDNDGYFQLQVSEPSLYKLSCNKELFDSVEQELEFEEGKEKAFVKIEMQRSPGYKFEITLAEKRIHEDIPTKAIKGALIEIYNNTTKEIVKVLEDYNQPEFDVDLEKGNHYTILVRKKGYMAKRLEAYVNVKGCILCFEGIGSVDPGVSDNLTENNQMGVLLANVELDSIFRGMKMEINDIYYASGKYEVTPSAAKELDKIPYVLFDNPHLKIEFGSHTDATGSDQSNMELSKKRAKAAAKYLVEVGGVPQSRMFYRGYGETEIKNDCVDGVVCSDAEHAINRRTELKILEIGDEKIDFKSLAVMKQAEHMDALLEEIQNEGQIQISDDGKTFLNKGVPDVLENLQTKQPKEKQTFDESTFESELKIEEISSTDKMKQDADLDQRQLDALEGEDAINVKTPENDLNTIEDEIIMEDMDEEVLDVDSKTIDSGEKSMDDLGGFESIGGALENYSGYKIVVKESVAPIEKADPLYTTHPNLIEVYYKSKVFFYLISDFDNIDDAYHFLRTSAKLMYPNSYVVKVENGKIMKK